MAGQRLLIIGAGGHALSVAEAARAAGFEVVGFAVTAEASHNRNLMGLPVIAESSMDLGDASFVLNIAIGDNFQRAVEWTKLVEKIDPARFATIVHPSAVVSPSATIGQGSVILPGSAIGPMVSVGSGCIVNTSAVIEHESILGDFSSLGPGVTLGGQVTVEMRSAIGIGATVKHGVRIGSDSVVGSASYVHADLSDEVVAFGLPATVRRTRSPGDTYL